MNLIARARLSFRAKLELVKRNSNNLESSSNSSLPLTDSTWLDYTLNLMRIALVKIDIPFLSKE